MGLEPYYVDKFAIAGNTTWEEVFSGDEEAIARAIAFGEATVAYEPPTLHIVDAAVSGPHGDVPVRIYAPPEAPGPLPCLVWLHGGAYQYGDLDMVEAHGVAAELASRTPIVVVSVDYRLAPAFHYPVPVDDCEAVVRWLAAGSLGRVDPTKVAVGGASAGANLATATCLRLRDAGDDVVSSSRWPIPGCTSSSFPRRTRWPACSTRSRRSPAPPTRRTSTAGAPIWATPSPTRPPTRCRRSPI